MTLWTRHDGEAIRIHRQASDIKMHLESSKNDQHQPNSCTPTLAGIIHARCRVRASRFTWPAVIQKPRPSATPASHFIRWTLNPLQRLFLSFSVEPLEHRTSNLPIQCSARFSRGDSRKAALYRLFVSQFNATDHQLAARIMMTPHYQQPATQWQAPGTRSI